MAKSGDAAAALAHQLDVEVNRPDGRGIDAQPLQVSPTAAPHDDGSQANETIDGLDPETEAVRHAAEDIPSDTPGDNDVPVFDRASILPKI